MPVVLNNPAVMNGVTITLHQGINTRLAVFGGTLVSPKASVPLPGPTPLPGVFPFAVVGDLTGLVCGLISGTNVQPFTVTNGRVSVETKVKRGLFTYYAVLLGAAVETGDGWTGVVAAEHCAGAGLVVN